MEDLTKEEERLSYIWFFVAGAIAFCFAFMVYRSDVVISQYHENDRTERAQLMHELRLAQTSLSSGAVDPRISSVNHEGVSTAPASVDEADSEPHDHH